MRDSASGFTLIELAVVIVIIGVLLGVVLTPLATRIQMQQVRDQQRSLDEIRDALLGFAQIYGRLPCADTNGDGREDFSPPPNDDDCVVFPIQIPPPPTYTLGELPYRTLGINATDRWGRRYVYAVSLSMTYAARTGEPAPNPGLDLADLGVINLNLRLEDKSLQPIASVPGSGAAAIVVSLGSNGAGGVDIDGNVLVAPVGADEIENTDDTSTFVTRTRTEGADTCSDTVAGDPFCEFDDLVVIIPTPLLLGRLVQAGRLP